MYRISSFKGALLKRFVLIFTLGFIATTSAYAFNNPLWRISQQISGGPFSNHRAQTVRRAKKPLSTAPTRKQMARQEAVKRLGDVKREPRKAQPPAPKGAPPSEQAGKKLTPEEPPLPDPAKLGEN